MYKHKDIEPKILRYWEENKIFEKVRKLREKNEPFYFCDGPPYATGQIHPGTGWNKTIKDTVCRYKRLKGYDVMARPGYDTHGLPIEVKVETKLGIKNKDEIETRVGIENFIEECRAFANKYVSMMETDFKNLGVWMEWNNPYITYKDHYIESSWITIKKAKEKNLLYEGNYVVPYCYRCETPLANYELEYGEQTDPSIYVKFKLKGEDNRYLIIWTTTPWTLVSNMAVMAHPDMDYVEVAVDNEYWILLKNKYEELLNKAGKTGVLIKEFKGKELEGLEYELPLQSKIKKEYNRRVVLSDQYVTDEDGTGLVHTAPGHGPEDYVVGKRNGIEIFSPVDDKGRYTEEAGDYKGMNVREANQIIIKDLEELGALVHLEKIKHRYPHCWRCKTPLIFRATNQWFVEISRMKDKMLEQAETTEWNPKYAKERFKIFVNDAPDWCISRQRYWGIPLPIWKCKNGHIKIITSKKELGKEIKELHRPWIDSVVLKCEECGEPMHRIPDVLDVWFDSGNAVWSGLTEEERKRYGEKADVIIEAQDQIRGWFYSLLGSGVIKNDEVPYKHVIMHGYFVDEKGEKMSKSVGNFVPLADILDKYGADAFRLWSMSNTIWEELRFVWNELKVAYSNLNIIYNMMQLLKRFYPEQKIEQAKLNIEDEWILSRLHSTLKLAEESYETYYIHNAVNALKNFLLNDVSRYYLKMVKDRLKGGDNKEGALYTFYEIMFNSFIALSPVIPFITEYFYQEFFKRFEGKESISMHDFPAYNDELINKEKEDLMAVVFDMGEALLRARQEVGIKLRWPLSKIYVKGERLEQALDLYEDVFKVLGNIKSIVREEPSGDYLKEELKDGSLWIAKEIDKETYEEGMANELTRRIQLMRKELKMKEDQAIGVSLEGDEELLNIYKNYYNTIALKANISGEAKEYDLKKDWAIEGKTITIKVKRL